MFSRTRLVPGISLIGGVAQRSGFYVFHSSALCRELSRTGLFAKSLICHLHLRYRSSKHYPRFLTIDEKRNKDRFESRCFAEFESSRLITRGNKSSTILRVFYHPPYHSLCLAFNRLRKATAAGLQDTEAQRMR